PAGAQPGTQRLSNDCPVPGNGLPQPHRVHPGKRHQPTANMYTDVCIVYNEPRCGAFDAAGEGAAVAGVLDAVGAVSQALDEKGYSLHLLPVRPGGCNDMLRRLSQLNPRVIFNLFEGFDRDPHSEGMIAALLEETGIPVTGAPSPAL